MTGLTQAVVDRLGLQVGELLAEHTSGRPLEDFQKWKDDPAGFAVQYGAEPTDYQTRIMESVVSSKYTVVRGCHGSGKNGSRVRWQSGLRTVVACSC